MLRVSDLICARQLFDCLPPACRPQDDNDNDDDDDDDDDDQGCIFRLTCSHPELTEDHVLTSAQNCHKKCRK